LRSLDLVHFWWLVEGRYTPRTHHKLTDVV
jgi:hypothetical protein